MGVLHKKNLKRLLAKGESRTVSASFTVSEDDHDRIIYNPSTSGLVCTIPSTLQEDFRLCLVNGDGVETTVTPAATEQLSLGGGDLHTAGSGVILRDRSSQTWQKIGSAWVGVAGSAPSGVVGLEAA